MTLNPLLVFYWLAHPTYQMEAISYQALESQVVENTKVEMDLAPENGSLNSSYQHSLAEYQKLSAVGAQPKVSLAGMWWPPGTCLVWEGVILPQGFVMQGEACLWTEDLQWYPALYPLACGGPARYFPAHLFSECCHQACWSPALYPPALYPQACGVRHVAVQHTCFGNTVIQHVGVQHSILQHVGIQHVVVWHTCFGNAVVWHVGVWHSILWCTAVQHD